MVRPRSENPTPAELEVLRVLWERGACTVRDVMEALNPDRPRAYTSVMSLMNLMAEKGMLRRKPKGRAYAYSSKLPREKTLSRMVGELLDRAFDGSASAMVTQLIERSKPSDEELDEIRKTLSDHKRKKGGR